MNFSIHLPDPLLADLDAFAKMRQTSRSGVMREAVREYLASHALQVWPADLERWMREPLPPTPEHATDFDAIRADERGDAQAHCPKGQALMRYPLDTNIVSAWARKSSSALMLKLAQTPPAALLRLHPARAALAPARDSFNAGHVTRDRLLRDRAYALFEPTNSEVVSAKNPPKWPKLSDFRGALVDPPQLNETIPPVRITLLLLSLFHWQV